MSSALDQATIDAAAARIDGELIALRREIHRHPELAGGERRTAVLVAERLRAAGLDVTTGVGGHGVVAVLDGAGAAGGTGGGTGGSDRPTVAYRADMDAVEDVELTGGDFASTVPGVGHLCGHDLHTAVGVGVAQVLAAHRERLAGRVLFLFQPAEETLAGARAMIEDGVLGRTPPREVYALHCGPVPVGEIAVMPGFGLPGLDSFHVELTGPDAAATGKRLAALIDGLSTVHRPDAPEDFQRFLDELRVPDGPLATFVLTGSRLTEAGGDGARLDGWVRAWPDERYAEVRDRVRDRAREAVAASAGGSSARIAFADAPFPAMVCSPELSEAAAVHLRGVLGADAVPVLHASFPFNGEDFALFLRRVPGAMFYLGVANPDAGLNGIPHSPYFAADERALGVGVRAMAGFLAARLSAEV